MTRNPDQYTLDFTSAANERCAMLVGLQDCRLPVDIAYGRVCGVIDLLQRLVLFAQYLPPELGSDLTIDAQVAYLATRIPSRTSVDPRTIRRWVADAESLGLLSVRINSHLRGGRSWNTYTVHFSRVIELLRAGRTRADMGGQNVRPIGRTKCPPLRADKMSAPDNALTNANTNDSLPGASSEDHGSHERWEPERVVSALFEIGMSKGGATKAVHAALERGLPPEEITRLIELYRELATSATADARVQPGWLYRWLTGQSTPPETAGAIASPDPDQQSRDSQRDFVRRESRRREIILGGRRRGISEAEIERRLTDEGLADGQ